MEVETRNPYKKLAGTVAMRLRYLATHGQYIPTAYYVLDERRLVYILIPKVASTSIKLATMDSVGGYSDNRDYMCIHRETAARQMYGLPMRAREYFKFAFVRNPFDRLVSCFEDKVRNVDPHSGQYYFDTRYNRWLIRRLFRTEFRPSMSFDEFIALVERIPDWLADSHFKSQYSILYLRGRQIPDYIGKFENLAADWGRIATQHNLRPLEQRNVSARTGWMEYYRDSNTVETVYRRYRKDIEAFGYQADYEQLIIAAQDDP